MPTPPYDLGADLVEAAAEMVAIERGVAEPARERVYRGNVLVEVREAGQTAWTLDGAGAPAGPDPDPAVIRARLRQTQEGIAELLGVSVKTYRNWEQGQRTPRGPARRLLEVASRHPTAFLPDEAAPRAA